MALADPNHGVTAEMVMASRRFLAQKRLSDFACLVDIPTVPLGADDQTDDFSVMKIGSLAHHHALLCGKLEDLEAGIIPNLMVLWPPGSAKSTIVDVVFAPWFMGRNPRRNVILAGYGSDIVQKQGRRTRALVSSPGYANLMGVGLRPGNRAVDEWSLTNGSEFMAGGLLSGLTGNRAALGIVDDPIKGREAAESRIVRDKVWDAYIDDFCSRLIPGAPQVMILTRWHQDDPAGRILPEDWRGESGWVDGRDGRRWYVICLPALADRSDDPLGRKIGESLWPEWYGKATGDPMDHWRPFRINHRTWSSLYQQKPSAEEGTFFRRDWFKRYKPEELPRRAQGRAPARPGAGGDLALNIYMTSDHAPGGGGEHDFNTFRVWGIDKHQGIWLLAGYRCQGTMDQAMGLKMDPASGAETLAVEGALPLIRAWKPLCWFPEADNNWKSVAPFVTASMKRHKARCRIEPLTTAGGDKATKAQAFQAKAAMGEVHLPVGFEADEIVEQYVAFPGGRLDDEVDCGANMGRALDMAHPAIVPPGVLGPRKRRDYGAHDDEDQSSDWRTV